MVSELIRLSTLYFVHINFWQSCDVVSTSLGRTLVTVAAFWIWHGLLLLSEQGHLSESVVKFLDFKTIRCVLLIFGRRVVCLTIFGADNSNNLALFAFLLGHCGPL